jgi:hypothetical protein
MGRPPRLFAAALVEDGVVIATRVRGMIEAQPGREGA